MKLPWLLLMFLGGGAASSLDVDTISIGNKIFSCYSKGIFDNGIAFQTQEPDDNLLMCTDQCGRHEPLAQSSLGTDVIRAHHIDPRTDHTSFLIDLDTLGTSKSILPNQSRHDPYANPTATFFIHSDAFHTFLAGLASELASQSDAHPARIEICGEKPPQQTEPEPEPSPPEYDPARAPSAVSSRRGAGGRAETRNPAPVNKAIAGMGAGLVGVMLVFTVFL
ncbi:hypothetical protein VTK56DRAFT_7086 [Thermocarpiscus australiensis]